MSERQGYAINRTRPTLWRAGATPEELARVDEIDRLVADLEAQRAVLVVERLRICNRACQRQHYDAIRTAST